MRFMFSSPFAAASFLVVACSGTPAVTPRATISLQPTAPATGTARPSAAPTPSAIPILTSDLISDEHVLDGALLAPDDPDHYGATLAATYFTEAGAHHAYVVGFGSIPGDQRPFHATSVDGIEWSVDPGDPLLGFESEFSAPGPVPGTVLQGPQGDWVMFFWGSPAPLPSSAQIYRATAESAAGPWSMEAEPVVPIGEPGEVDDMGLDFPAVLRTDNGWVMLYGANGGDAPHTARILLATSDDGITWEKRGRVIEPEVCGGSDTDYVAMPRLFADGDRFLAFAEMGGDVYALHSVDAVHWECQSDPVFPISAIEGGDRVHTFAAGGDGEDINLMIEALFTSPEGQVTSNIWMAQVLGR
jgi:hypothetical protein